MKCFIFGSAPVSDYGFCHNLIKENDFILCADGGIKHTEVLGLTPNLLIGDLDSFSSTENYKNIMRYPSEKDDTDMSLCIKYALDSNFTEIIIVGGLGGRLDHTLANVNLLAKYPDKQIKLIDKNTEVFAISNPCTVKKTDKKYISFISHTEQSDGVTYKGLKYPLVNATLYSKDAQFSISNEIIAEEAEISLKNGILICILANDES